MDFYHDSTLGVAICIRCETGMVPNGKVPFKNHLRAPPHRLVKGAFKATSDYLISLQLTAPSHVPYPPPAEQPVEAIPHLKPYPGYYCLLCDDWRSTSESKTRDHVTSAHRIRTGRQRRGYQSCVLQSIFHSPGLIRWFRVVLPRQDPRAAPPALVDVPQDLFLAQQRQVRLEIAAEECKQADLITESQGHLPSAPAWVQSCGFARYLKGYSKAELIALSKRPSPADDPDAPIWKIIQTAEELLDETWHWCLDGPDSRLTRPMAVVLSQFWTVANVHSKGFRPGIEYATKSKYFHRWQAAVIFLWRTEMLGRWPTRQESEKAPSDRPEIPINGDPPDGVPFFQCTPQQRHHLSACVDAVGQKDDASLREHVFALSLALIQHSLPRDRFMSPLLSFCATLSLRAGSQEWQPAGDFNHHLSALIYCAQLWIFRSVCRHIDEDPGRDPDTELTRLCQQWFRQEKSTTFGIILNWRLMLFRVSKQDVAARYATWSLDNQEVCYRGTNISMVQIGQLYRHAVDEARQILDRDLLLGADHFVRMSAEHLSESEHRQDVHWWFGLDPRNKTLLQGHQTAVENHILGTPHLRQLYIEAYQGKERYRPEAIGLYDDAVQRFLQHWFAAFHVCVPPLRAKDVLTMTWRNTELPRSIYIKHRRVMVYVNHHKSQAYWTQSRDNVRMLPVDLGNLLLDFLVLVQPQLGHFEWQTARRLLPSHLWTRHGELWKEAWLTKYLRAAGARAQGPSMGLSPWRHIAASIIKVKFAGQKEVFGAEADDSDSDGLDDDDGEHEDIATLARMSNHSVRTHNRAYANATGFQTANVWDGLIKRAYRASLLWATFFGFGDEGERNHVRGTRRRRLDVDDDDRGMVKRIATALPPPRRHWSGAALLREARRLLQDENLQWRCPEQEQAMLAVVSGAPEVLVVLATGAGKSLLFQLPCSLPGARSTVVVVPLVGLRLDVEDHCRRMGIDCDVWQPGSRTQAPLVFVGVEHAGEGSFFQYLYDLHQARQLDRIVFEEAHLVLTAESYRRAMSRLVALRAIPVPCIYLTATLPLYLRDQLFQRHHLTTVTEIRGSSRRGSLRYRIQHLERGQPNIITGTADIVQALWAEKYATLGAHQRCLIFTRTKQDSEQLAGLLGCDYYHADVGDGHGDTRAKGEILNRWRAGTFGPFLVGTSGLGAGLNYASVRLVVHADEPRTLVAFSQESGRAGRDQEAAECVVVLRRGWRPPDSSLVGADEAALHHVLTTRGCRRAAMAQFLDTRPTLARCGEGEEACDRCQDDLEAMSTPDVEPEIQEGAEQEAPERSLVHAVDPVTGPVMLLRARMHDQQGWDQYLRGLEGLRGQCIMCRLAGREWRHPLTACKHPDKWVFINGKRELLAQGGSRWITPYSACYRCYQPQGVCEVGGGGGRCEYPDVVMPGMVALWLGVGHQQWLLEAWQVRFESVTECLRWAGQRDQMGDEVCVRGVRVMAAAIQKLGSMIEKEDMIEPGLRE
jgi:hypothetical protein